MCATESELIGPLDKTKNDMERLAIKDEDDNYTDLKAYKQLCPLLSLMRIFGLYFKRCHNKHGHLRTECWMVYCMLISCVMILNVLRSFTVYRFGDEFNHALVQKLLFTIWSSECALKGILLIVFCYRMDGLPQFFKKWKSTCHNVRLDKLCLLMMKKYIFLTFLFMLANSVVFILVLMYVPILDNIYLEVVWRDALMYGKKWIFKTVLGVFAILLSTSSMLPVSLFVVLSCAVGKEMNQFTKGLVAAMYDEDFHGKFEDFRLRHQNLATLVDILDRIFAPMIAAVYSANIPMFCLVLYTMVTSIEIHLSLLLINVFWLGFILLQMTIVSITAAWVNVQVTYRKMNLILSNYYMKFLIRSDTNICIYKIHLESFCTLLSKQRHCLVAIFTILLSSLYILQAICATTLQH